MYKFLLTYLLLETPIYYDDEKMDSMISGEDKEEFEQEISSFIQADEENENNTEKIQLEKRLEELEDKNVKLINKVDHLTNQLETLVQLLQKKN